MNAFRHQHRSPPEFKLGSHVELGHALVNDLGGRGIVVATDGQMYRYEEEDGIYHRLERELLEQHLHTYDGLFIPSADGREKPLKLTQAAIAGSRACAMAYAHDADFFANAPDGIAFANGFVQVDADGTHVLARSPDNRARDAMPFAYDTRARCDRFLRALGEMFATDADAQAKIDLLQEFAGIALIGKATRFQAALILFGEGANGKSVVLLIIGALFPKTAIASIAPQDIGQEYRRALLAGKRLNVVNEIPEREVLDSEAVKAVITGELIQGREIREAPFDFRPIAGHLFAGNRLPGTTDQSHGFWRRFLPIEFTRIFRPDEQDRELADKIIRDELPGVAVWALEGAVRLLRAGKYTMPASTSAALAAWKLNADHVREFAADRVKASDTVRTGGNLLYQTYARWAKGNGHASLPSNKFAERMRALGFVSKRGKTGTAWLLHLVAGHDDV